MGACTGEWGVILAQEGGGGGGGWAGDSILLPAQAVRTSVDSDSLPRKDTHAQQHRTRPRAPENS